MTSTADTDQHPDVSEISDLTEGLLSASRTADVRHHIDGCALCDDVQNSLQEIRGLLGTLPESPRMPDAVAGRIDAALAAEALLNATAPAGATSVSRETEAPAEETAGSTLSPADRPAVRPAGHPRGTTGPSRRPTRRRRRTAVLGAAFGTAVVGVSIFLLQSVQPSGSSDASKMADRSSSAAESGAHTFSEGTLEGRVEVLLNSASASQVPGNEKSESTTDSQLTPEVSSGDPSASRNPLRASAVSVPSCVQQGTGRTTQPLAVEQGTYQGTDAYLVVLPHPTDASRVQAYVVDAVCEETGSATPGKLLLTHSYPRP